MNPFAFVVVSERNVVGPLWCHPPTATGVDLSSYLSSARSRLLTPTEELQDPDHWFNVMIDSLEGIDASSSQSSETLSSLVSSPEGGQGYLPVIASPPFSQPPGALMPSELAVPNHGHEAIVDGHSPGDINTPQASSPQSSVLSNTSTIGSVQRFLDRSFSGAVRDTEQWNCMLCNPDPAARPSRTAPRSRSRSRSTSRSTSPKPGPRPGDRLRHLQNVHVKSESLAQIANKRMAHTSLLHLTAFRLRHDKESPATATELEELEDFLAEYGDDAFPVTPSLILTRDSVSEKYGALWERCTSHYCPSWVQYFKCRDCNGFLGRDATSRRSSDNTWAGSTRPRHPPHDCGKHEAVEKSGAFPMGPTAKGEVRPQKRVRLIL